MSDRLHDMMSELAQEIANRLHAMMSETAQEVATEVIRVLKADKSGALVPIGPVFVPRLTLSSPKYLTQKDLARLFRVSSRTIYTWRTKGKLPAVSVLPNGRQGWREDEIEKWMATRVKPKRR